MIKENSTGILTIDQNTFDIAVWQDKTNFTQKDYNIWLKNAVLTLQDIYDKEDIVSPSHLYILGDIINMLNTIKIKISK